MIHTIALAAILACSPTPAASSPHIDHLRHLGRHAAWCAEDFTPGGLQGVCLTPDDGGNVITVRSGNGFEHLQPDGTTTWTPIDPCELEDGSGQLMCRWDAGTAGLANGGDSFTFHWIGPGPDDRLFHYDDGRIECSDEGTTVPCPKP